MSTMPVVVAAITAATDAIGTTSTVYESDGPGWRTLPADTPANTMVGARLTGAGRYTRTMADGKALFGAMRASFGSLRLSNADGALDAWRTYGFDGRAITLYFGDDRAPFPAGFSQIFTTETLRATIGFEAAELVLRDPMQRLDKPLVRETFAGTGGLEGPIGLTGQPKPRALGQTFFTPMIQLSAVDQIYFVCTDASGPSFAGGATIYDGGVALTLGADYATLADLVATAPAPGQARLYAGGPTYVRFGSEPAFEPTLTRTWVPAGPWFSLMPMLAAEAGLAIAPGVSGPNMSAYVDDIKTTYLEVFTRESMVRPRWFGIDRNGKFTTETVVDPVGGISVADIRALDVLNITRTTPDGLDVPLWRVTAQGDRNYSKDRTRLAGAAVSAARQAFLNADTVADAAVLLKHPSAGELAIVLGNDPRGAPAAHFALHGVDRDVFRVEVAFDLLWLTVDLNKVVTLYHPRFNLAAGRKLLVIGIDLDFAARRISFYLWG